MKNCLILGTGRSGTSLASGILSKAGYFMGNNLMPATRANPKGFFESFDIEQINEDILRKVVKQRPKILEWWSKQNLSKGQFWLARVDPHQTMPTDTDIDARISREVAKAPFCFKDPRFSYTLPAWRPLLPEDTVFLCIFRHPTATSRSILKQINNSPLLRHLKYSFDDTLQLWEYMYSHILDRHGTLGKWLYLHYDQLLEEEGWDRIERFTGAVADKTFPEKKLNLSCAEEIRLPVSIKHIYERLCELSGKVSNGI